MSSTPLIFCNGFGAGAGWLRDDKSTGGALFASRKGSNLDSLALSNRSWATDGCAFDQTATATTTKAKTRKQRLDLRPGREVVKGVVDMSPPCRDAKPQAAACGSVCLRQFRG